jgi:ribosome-binding protein aMBF1 (putative translation factor)
MGSLQNDKVSSDSSASHVTEEMTAEGEIDMRDLIAHNLQKLRNNRGLSLVTLSARSRVSYWTLQEVELGRALPTIEVLWKVARVLGVPCDAFVETAEAVPVAAAQGRVADSH